ncbi:efflux RND transporter permease subunit [Bacillus sp. 2205SS5-2]|uniref:efflux RND transporter permease subunit n=1 Tax=Bacillus sp. 2205SS5-2 TaxID=3109031 RepID=UPI003007E5E6
MNWMTRFSLKNTIAVIILTILVVSSGLLASNKIKVETFPDVTFPVMTVQTVFPNASTEEVEEKVTKPVEEALLSLPDYESITSISRDNLSLITITYPFGQDIDEAQADIQQVISDQSLPNEVQSTIQAISSDSMPIFQAALASDDLTSLQENVQTNIVPSIENLEGVSSVKLTGKVEDKIAIVVDEEKATAHGITLSAIREALQQAEYKLPFGSLNDEGTSIPVEMRGTLGDLEAIENISIPLSQQAPIPSIETERSGELPISQNETESTTGLQITTNQNQPSQKSVLLSEVAEVNYASSRTEISRFNGEDSILLEVIKEQEANTADVANEVKSYLEKVVNEKEYDLYIVVDQGEEVEKSISALLKEGGFGALFTVFVILLFLRNIRATLIAIISLPISILGSIALLEQFGYTLNIMTLGGMAIAVGRIVDDSIVVIENIYRWKQLYPEMNQKELVYKATSEVMGAIASSTLATLIVFLPLGLVSGILGEFFRPFSLAVVFSVTISLLVAIILIPVLGKQFFKKVNHQSKESRLMRRYESLLRGTLKRKWMVFILSFLLLIGSFSLIPALGMSFLPSEGSDSFEIEVTLPPDTSLEETNELVQKVENELTNEDNIDYYQVSIGFSSQRQLPGVVASTNENIARFFIKLKDYASLDESMIEVEKQILTLSQAEFSGATAKATEIQPEGPPAGNSIEVNLYSDNTKSLYAASKQVSHLLEQDEDLKNIRNDLEDTNIKYQLELTDYGKELKVNPLQLMQPIQERLHGIDGGNLSLKGEEWDLELSFDQTFTSKEELETFSVQTMAGTKKLEEIVDIQEVQVPSSIKHQEGENASTVSATIKGSDTSVVSSAVEEDLNSLSLPEDVQLEVTGGMEMISEGFADLGLAMGAAVGLVFLVLSVTFGGIITPIVILSSLIFIPIGSLAGLLITGQTLSMSAMIGMLMLIGIVVTNAVVLLDRVETNRKQGIVLTEAIIEASVTRLRPILMTALATIFALIPLSLTNSASGLISKGLAITVIGGLTTSTLLTLIFVPVLYHTVGKFRKFD